MNNPFDLTIADTASDSTMALRELCTFHPDDPTLHIQLAERLQKTGHEIEAIFVARKAYEILCHENNPQANDLVDTFGEEILTDNIRPFISQNYLKLAKHFSFIATLRRKIQLKEGEVLFHKDEAADYIYLILEGEIAINIQSNDHFRILNYLYAGAIVGEGALKSKQTRSAMVVANVDCTLLRFSPEEFSDALKNDPELNFMFSKESMIRRNVTALSSAEIFARLRIDLRFMIAKRSWPERAAAEDVIKQPKKYMHHVALLVQGSVRMMMATGVGEHIYCGRFKAGDLIGAQRFVEDKPSSMAFIAETDCSFIYMDFTILEDIMELSPWFKHKLTEINEQFISQSRRTLSMQKIGK